MKTDKNWRYKSKLNSNFIKTKRGLQYRKWSYNKRNTPSKSFCIITLL